MRANKASSIQGIHSSNAAGGLCSSRALQICAHCQRNLDFIHAFIEKRFIEHILCARCCSKCLGYNKTNCHDLMEHCSGGYGRQNNDPHKDFTAWWTDPVDVLSYMEKETLQMWLRPWDVDCPRLFWWAQSNHLSLYKHKLFCNSERKRCDDTRRSEGCSVAGFEDGGRGPWAKECGWPLESGKRKDTDFP